MANFTALDHEGLQRVDGCDGLQVLGSGQGLHAGQHEKEPYVVGQVAGAWRQSPLAGAAGYREPTRILGLRRPTFWLLVSNIVLAVALVVVGVVPAQMNMNRKTEVGSAAPAGGCAASAIGSSTSTTVGPAQATATSQPNNNEIPNPKVCFSTTTPLAPGSDPGLPPGIECPISAGQVDYTVPGTGLKFQKMCGTDFGGSDMGRFPVRSMDDCLALCAQLNLFPASVAGKCVGATWVYGDGPQGTGVNFCFPKNDTSAATRRAGTESAVLLR